ncbi:hypothetical protein T10_9052 [Trichinella papuae]|uniref:Uncharacterized protein n=1 Tax=Trichinella papuae TaxID=268474 RepID=A0A0V1N8A2_9BILA|nr:hypothetical protein T10_9052 [Trichinella papuae]
MHHACECKNRKKKQQLHMPSLKADFALKLFSFLCCHCELLGPFQKLTSNLESGSNIKPVVLKLFWAATHCRKRQFFATHPLAMHILKGKGIK